MERLTSISSPINTTTKLESGTVISVQQKEVKLPIPNDTEIHEAKHAILAKPGEIVLVTSIPEGNALGQTILRNADPIAAAGPASDGHSGVSFDEYQIIRMGYNPEAMKAAARSELKWLGEEVNQIASDLHVKRTMGQADIDHSKQKVADRKSGIFEVEVHITKPEGGTLQYISQTINNKVDVEVEESPLPLAA